MSLSYSFPTLKHYRDIHFKETVIWVLYATKKPPHIGISTENYFFSLKISGKDENILCDKLITQIHKKSIPTVFIQLKTVVLLANLQGVFKSCAQIELGKTTCLSPIKTCLCEPQVQQLSDLLYRIEAQIEQTAGVYLPETYTQLPAYCPADIATRISDMQK